MSRLCLTLTVGLLIGLIFVCNQEDTNSAVVTGPDVDKSGTAGMSNSVVTGPDVEKSGTVI